MLYQKKDRGTDRETHRVTQGYRRTEETGEQEETGETENRGHNTGDS